MPSESSSKFGEAGRRRFDRLLPLLVALAGLVWLLVANTLGPQEALRATAGLVALWLPGAWLIFLLLRDACGSPLDRCVLSFLGSYVVTTMAYHVLGVFGLWLPGIPVLFYVGQLLVLAVCLYHTYGAVRRGERWSFASMTSCLDPVLLLLIVGSLLVTQRYKAPFVGPDARGVRHLAVDGDHTYYTALVYELGRHVPALQQPIRAGVRERAYHMYPHLTTMLVGRYTGQEDLLRAHLLYEYSVIDTLICLAAFCLVRRITGNPLAGYLGVSLPYVLAVLLPPLAGEPQEAFYFTLHPQASSSLEPTIMTSPQMYCGIMVVYGIFLAFLTLTGDPARTRPSLPLAVLLGLMVGALIRFRVQAFLPLFPAFALVMVLGAMQRSRRRAFAAAIVVAGAVAFANHLEMGLSVYLPRTSEIRFGNNQLALTMEMFSRWPFSGAVREFLQAHCSREASFRWLWQLLCMSMFATMTMIGLPMLGTCIAYFSSASARRTNLLFSLLNASLLLFSLVGATCLAAGYDSYSVGGQMPLHFGWYVTPIAAAGAWFVWEGIQARLHIRPRTARWCAYGTLLVAIVWQMNRSPSALQQVRLARGKMLHLSADAWETLLHIRDRLPPESVILPAAQFHFPNGAIVPGIGGKRDYLDYIPVSGIVFDRILPTPDTTRFRLTRTAAIWGATSSEMFRQELLATGATHVVEYTAEPLPFHPGELLHTLPDSTHGLFTIWEVRR